MKPKVLKISPKGVKNRPLGPRNGSKMSTWGSKWAPRGSFWRPMGLRVGPGRPLGCHLMIPGGEKVDFGSPKGGQRGPKSDQNEVKSRKNEGQGPKRRKAEAEVRFGTFFYGLWVEQNEKIETHHAKQNIKNNK